MAFLVERVPIWERSATKATHPAQSAEMGSRNHVRHGNRTPSARANPLQADAGHSSSFKCTICGQRDFHYVSRCPTFLKKSPSERRALLRDINCCYNCLAPGHRLGECKSKGTCCECHERHHTLLHTGRKPTSGVQIRAHDEPQREASGSKEAAPTSKAGPAVLAARGAVVFSCTVQLPCIDAYGGVVHLRAMLDTGSQVDLITSSAVEKQTKTWVYKPNRPPSQSEGSVWVELNGR